MHITINEKFSFMFSLCQSSSLKALALGAQLGP
jgi:hypothetical protein